MQAQSPSFEHGFARDYAQSRAAFVHAARQVGARHWQVMHPDRGMQGEALSMDLAWLGPASAQRVLVSLSGTHGIEGFAGSACQRAWLATDAPGHLPPDTAVLLVHAVNPWGFAWLRRVDAQNIDVNRNALHAWRTPPANPDYAQFHALLMQHAPTSAEAAAGFMQALQAWMAQLGASASVAVHWLGKFKTAAQMIAIPCLLYHRDILGLPTARIGSVLIFIAAILTVWSMLYYLRRAWPVIREKTH